VFYCLVLIHTSKDKSCPRLLQSHIALHLMLQLKVQSDPLGSIWLLLFFPFYISTDSIHVLQQSSSHGFSQKEEQKVEQKVQVVKDAVTWNIFLLSCT